jgi:hypothetical protein
MGSDQQLGSVRGLTKQMGTVDTPEGATQPAHSLATGSGDEREGFPSGERLRGMKRRLSEMDSGNGSRLEEGSPAELKGMVRRSLGTVGRVSDQ